MKKSILLLLVTMLVLLVSNGCNQSNTKHGEIEEPTLPKEVGVNNSDKEQDLKEDKEQTQEDKEQTQEKLKGNTLRIIFAGDTMMDSHVAGVMEEKGYDYPLMEFMPILAQSDLVVFNLETSVGTSRNLMEKTYAFQTNPKHFSLFYPLQEKLVFTLANNHGMDGPLSETMREMDNLQYQYIGIGKDQETAFRPYVKEINGVSIALFGVSRVIPHSSWTARENHPGMATAYSFEPLVSYIKEWKRKVNHVIVFIHWGEELGEKPNQHQLKLDEKLVEAGASVIVGGHPHVIQELKWWETGQLTAYSLGNFVFTTSRHNVANELIALELELSKEKIEFAKVWPGKIKFGLVQNLEGQQDGEKILTRLQRMSPTIKIDHQGQVTPLQ